ncbi:MAG: D-serine ammonia-lyase [Treponema sp.]|jgi:D-serine dehydratase|nr:D-serine ammonia-lyase [Treponema sp.]
MTDTKVIGGKTIARWKQDFPILAEAAALKEVFWINPHYTSGSEGIENRGVTPAEMDGAADRLTRFAAFAAKAYPETRDTKGLIESPLREAPRMLEFLKKEADTNIPGRLLVKCDNLLPIAGSIKARGGIYEALCHAEALAWEEGLLKAGDSYDVFLNKEFHDLFAQRELAVGSTGNLGLSIGIIGAKLGFKTTVHMSADARQWKKAMLRERGVTVVEYEADYSKAVAGGRRQAGPDCHFVDDENSKNLFLGYSVAALRLQKQLEAMRIPVDPEHPLCVYLPCGVGGGPGGVTYGIKRLYGDAARCFFVEPTHAPCMLLGLVTGCHDKVSVGDFGIDNKTCADGLAVGRPSSFAGKVMDALLSGAYTVSDEHLYYLLYNLAELEDIWLEPSAAAGFMGPARLHTSAAGKSYLKNHPCMDKAVHIVWATGGGMVPAKEMRRYYDQGKEIAAGFTRSRSR